jgi:signal transduction histidine kinase
LIAALCLLAPFPARAQNAPPPAQAVQSVSSLAELRALSPGEAARKLPLAVRATVSAANWNGTFFIQDETGGCFASVPREFRHIVPGDRVEVEGTSMPGKFVPGVSVSFLRVLGHGPLPEPVAATFEDLLSGRLHYQRVAVCGVVRSVERREDTTWALTLAMGIARLEVRYRPRTEVPLPALVDALVHVRGLAAGSINERRQLVSPQVFINDPADIEVVKQAPEDPFSAPLCGVSDLLNFAPRGLQPHRVRVRGTVTFHRPGELLFLRDRGLGVLVQSRRESGLSPGEVVEVAGFPVMGAFSAMLEDADFQRVGNEAAPEPVATSVAEVLKGDHDADLVSLEASLSEVWHAREETLLLLRSGETVFHGRLPRTAWDIPSGASLRVTGVCRVDSFTGNNAFRAQPRTIELLLRSMDDVAVLHLPSRWTSRRLAVAALSLGLLVVAALAWVAVLRRRVREQTEVIRRRIEREAVLEERQRVAREMHDTLAQSFSGVGFQLEALDARLAPDPSLRNALDTAKHLVRQGQEEFRRSLLNLRTPEAERGALVGTLREFGRMLTEGSTIRFEISESGTLPSLPEALETNLLRMCQESLTNALRHAEARTIVVEVAVQGGELRVSIRDDGCGFDPASLEKPEPGHFGWRGIRERAHQIGARVACDSSPGAGTCVRIVLPIAGDSLKKPRE